VLHEETNCSSNLFRVTLFQHAGIPERRNTRALNKQIKFLYGSTYRTFAQAMLLRAFLGVPAGTTQGERVR